MARSKQDPTGSTSLPDNMARSWGAQYAVLANNQLLNAIRSSNASNQLDGLRIVETSISTDNEERILSALWDGLEDAGNEGFGIVRLLEDSDLLAKTRSRETKLLVAVVWSWVGSFDGASCSSSSSRFWGDGG